VDSVVPAGLPMPHWSWNGLQPTSSPEYDP
jgi:hypothetical protein